MDRHMDAQVNTIIAPDIFYIYAKIELCSLSQTTDIHVLANLANYPLEDLKCMPINNHFGYRNVRILHTYTVNITLIFLKLIYKKVI